MAAEAAATSSPAIIKRPSPQNDPKQVERYLLYLYHYLSLKTTRNQFATLQS
jgi:hypothetical protein